MRPGLKRAAKIAALLVAVVLVALQFVPVERTNRLGAGDPDAPRDVQWILRRACYDCHSTETRWPIWAYVAPLSWRVVGDVERARARLNFSDWAAYDSSRRAAERAMVGPVTAAHRMPLWYYVTLHPDAGLSPTDVALLQAWSRGTPAE
ncbi:MAG: heme-binding domain-containing protein [Gemmatimonadales bacterium]